ncbi:MAG: glutaredoxin family protein [Burkholderiales bacterium]
MLALTLYGREHCHLCDEMKDALTPHGLAHGFVLSVVDVDGDTTLQQRYGHLVPVLVDGEQEICHYHLDWAALDAYLRKIR